MRSRLVSVIIPVYNNAEFLGDAITSVLNQTYPNFELIVVNDASPDNAIDVISAFRDSRIKYIAHEKNKGLSAARNTGIKNSTGDFIALLDGDDYFHPDKLKAHVEFLETHPDIDVTYNPRFELNHSATTIRDLWRPPLHVGLAELILGYPFAPSDMVIRRECMFRAGLFDISYTYYGEDLDINCKLAIEGCKFASVDRVLNYRRFHSRRIIKNLSSYKEDELRPLYKTFSDSRFPDALLYLKNKALSNRYVGWSIFAYLQDDNVLGGEYALEAIQLNPSLLEGKPCELLANIIHFCTIDENIDHEALIRHILDQLPKEIRWLCDQADWAVSRGYLIRGIRSVIWGRVQDGKSHFIKARALGAQIDEQFLRQLSAQLISYRTEFGAAATRIIVGHLSPLLMEIGSPADVRWLKGCYSVNTAFRSYEVGEYSKVPGAVLHTIMNDPSYIFNRGVIKIFLKSLVSWGS